MMVFSNFGHFFSFSEARRAEQTSSRLPFQRHDIDPDERHHDDQREKTHFDTEDHTSVSVKALLIFLKNLLKSSETADKHMHLDFDTAKNNPPQRQKVGHAAKAAGAYERGANFSESHAASHPGFSSPHSDISLSTEEIETIHQLIGDLEDLLKRGLDYLQLEKGPTLLDMLKRAVRFEKAKF